MASAAASARRRREMLPQVGGVVSPTPPCLVAGRRRLVVGFGKSLRGYLCDEGASPRPAAAFHGHQARIVALAAVGNMRVASASNDGTVRIWGVDDGACLRTVEVARPHDMVALEDGRLVVASGQTVFMLGERDAPRKVVLARLGKPIAAHRRLAASADGAVLATICGPRLTVAFTRDGQVTTLQIPFARQLSAVAVSSNGRRIAVGDLRGYIRVFRKVKDIARYDGGTHLVTPGTNCAALHWHSHHVTALRFVANGSVLYSGGCEGVLVAWKMTKTDFGKRNFKPRLGGAIWGIGLSQDESTLALTLADNAVRCIDVTSLQVVSTLRGLATDHLRTLPPWDVNVLTPFTHELIRMVPEPGNSGCALVSGMGNSVQLYDVFRGVNVADFQVVPRNVVMSGKRIDRREPLGDEKATVRLVVVSEDCAYMVTVTQDAHPMSESKLGEKDAVTETLKFWDYAGGGGRVTLLARLEDPHGSNGRITSVVFHPTLPIVVSASSNGSIMVWRAVRVPEDDGAIIWRCECTESYRGLSCAALCFSSDGSVLAAGCEGTVTLWILEDLVERYALPCAEDDVLLSTAPKSVSLKFLEPLVHSPKNEPVQHLSFVKQESTYLLATTCSAVYVWDVMNSSILWSLRIENRPECTVSDPATGYFALVIKFPSDLSPKAMEMIKKQEDEARKEEAGEDESETTIAAKNNDNKEKGEATVTKKLTFQDNQTPTSAKKKKRRPRSPRRMMDTAVAIFDCESQVPKSVTRLPVRREVAGIGFIGDNRKSNDVAKSLFCFDTSMEVVTLPNWDHAENVSDVTAQDETMELPEELNIIGELVGTEAVKCEAPEVRSGMPLSYIERAPIRNVLKKYVQGNAVTRRRVTDYAGMMMSDLARLVHATVPDGAEQRVADDAAMDVKDEKMEVSGDVEMAEE